MHEIMAEHREYDYSAFSRLTSLFVTDVLLFSLKPNPSAATAARPRCAISHRLPRNLERLVNETDYQRDIAHKQKFNEELDDCKPWNVESLTDDMHLLPVLTTIEVVGEVGIAAGEDGTGSEAWLVDWYKEHGVHFVVRPPRICYPERSVPLLYHTCDF